MAGIEDFFTPGARNDQAPDPTQQFMGFLEDPRARAGLLQAGLSLMGPQPWGQGPSGAVATAIGSAGEGIRSEEEQQQQEAEARSKIESRSSAASAREDKLNLQQQEIDRKI